MAVRAAWKSPSTPLKAAATEVNKLYQGYLHPSDTYGEHPPLGERRDPKAEEAVVRRRCVPGGLRMGRHPTSGTALCARLRGEPAGG